jgi:hypothetical protein
VEVYVGNGPTLAGYAELLQRALSLGLLELDSSVVQLPSDANSHHAVLLATARTDSGLVLRAVGEAYRDAASGDDRFALLTLAESRAKARVLSEVLCIPGASAAPLSSMFAEHVEEAAAGLPEYVDQTTRVAAFAAPATDTADRDSTSPRISLLSTPAAEETAGGMHAAAAPRFAVDSARGHAETRAMSPSRSPAAGPKSKIVSVDEAIEPDVLARLMHLTRRKAEEEGSPISEEEAMLRLDSYFQRAFGHPVAEGTQIEGQRVVQRLVSGGARVSAGARPVATRE